MADKNEASRELTHEELLALDDDFFSGEEGEKERVANDKKRAAARNFVRRFWVPVDAEKITRITFVDDDTRLWAHMATKKFPEGQKPPYQLYEHQLYLNGNWFNWFTCLGAKGKCPICALGESKAYFAAVYTVIDHSRWTDKRGGEHQDELRLFVAKPDVARVIAGISKTNEGLRGLVLDVSRRGEKDPNVGGNFSTVVKGTMTVLVPNKDGDMEEKELKIKEGKIELPDAIQPLPVRTLLAKKPLEDLLEVVGTAVEEDDDIPF